MSTTPTPQLLNRLRMRQVALLLAIGERGTLRAAAAQLGLTQPAATKMLQELEAAMGHALFDRVGRGLQLTDAGRCVLAYFEGLQGHFDAPLEQRLVVAQMVEAVREFDRGAPAIGTGGNAIPLEVCAFQSVIPKTTDWRQHETSYVWQGTEVHAGTDNNYAVAYFPADDRVLVTRDQGGNELDHLYVIEADGSERDLTPGEGLKADFLGFTADGSAFHVISNERDPRYFDVYRYDSASYERTRVYENTTGLEPAIVSGDGKWLALSQSNTTNDSDLFVVELATGKSTKVSEHEGQAAFSAQDFSPDGQWLYYTANDQGEFAQLRRVKHGELVTLRGMLVNVRDADGRVATTSTTAGDRDCEILWLEEIRTDRL